MKKKRNKIKTICLIKMYTVVGWVWLLALSSFIIKKKTIFEATLSSMELHAVYRLLLRRRKRTSNVPCEGRLRIFQYTVLQLHSSFGKEAKQKELCAAHLPQSQARTDKGGHDHQSAV